MSETDPPIPNVPTDPMFWDHISVQRDAHNSTYAANIQAVHQTASWMLGAATAANSGGFYFALKADSIWPSIAAASCFVISLASTFWSGILVTRVHASEALAADQVRRMTPVNYHQAFAIYLEASEHSRNADASLAKWSKASILSMALGGAALVIDKIGILP